MLDALKTKMFLASFKLKKASYRQIHANPENVEMYFKATGKTKVEVNGVTVKQKNGTLVVLVCENASEQITEVVKSLKENKETISTKQMSFKITKCYVDESGKLIAFCAETQWRADVDWNDMDTLKQLKIFVETVECMQGKGYLLQEERFKNENFASYWSELDKYNPDRVSQDIVEFLRLFDVKKGEVRSAGGCLIKYIHYALSHGGNLKNDYPNFYLSNNGALIISNKVPYNLRIIQMCYDYLEYGLVPTQISSILEQAIYAHKEYFKEYMIAVNKDLSSKLAIIEQTEEYTLYEGNIKIYQAMSENFADFLTSRPLHVCSNHVVEKMEVLIRDIEGEKIGYISGCTVEEGYKEKLANLSSSLQTPQQIANRIITIWNCLDKIRAKLLYATKDIRILLKANDNQFQIEEALLVLEEDHYMIKSIDDLYKLAYSNAELWNEQLTNLFFKWYLQYLNEKYGEISSKEAFMEKEEVRYLPPVVAKEFIKFSLGKSSYVKYIINELRNMFHQSITSKINLQEIDWYDERFNYNQKKVPFYFDYEIEQAYGIKLEKGATIQLPNGEWLTIFNHAKTIAKLAEKEAKMKYEVSKCFPIGKGRNIEYIGISKIIYSEKIGTDGMYKVLGYIRKPCKGNFLTDEFLLQCNNIEIYKIMGYLLSSFIGYYIPWKQISMDENFVFYINLLDDNLRVKNTRNLFNRKNQTMIGYFLDYLKEIGYNEYLMLDDSLAACSSEELLSKASRCDAFCEEHNLYYDSSKLLCPVCEQTKIYLDKSYIEEKAIKLYEDEVAVHYRMPEGGGDHRLKECNIKLYKALGENRAYLEGSVGVMMGKPNVFSQDCFIATKKVIDKNGDMIGYCYNAPNGIEQSKCIELTDTTKLNNLARLKSLIRLMRQVSCYVSNGYGFIQNPFSHVLLSRNHKRQVQILNIDFLSNNANLVDTIRWTFEYVYQTVLNDENLNVSLWLYKKQLELPINLEPCKNIFKETLDKLIYEAKKLTKYCPIHRLYYSNESCFCPKCVDQTEITNFEKVVVKKETITSKEEIGNGGESIIYPFGKTQVAKVFKEDVVDLNFKTIVLVRSMRKQSVLEGINKQNRMYQYINPQKLLVDRNTNTIFGYIMQKVDGGRPLSNLKDTEVIKDLGFTMQDVIEILISVGKGIETLHKNGIYIGDLNGRNILFDTQKRVYFLDFDGMGFDEIQPLFCTDEYIDPISKRKQNITMEDDWYSYAVQAFYYLTYTHPFNGIYTVIENGEKVNLDDVLPKMERRISLLGGHGIKVPAIARSWDWMSSDLENALINIFEGENRESILPYLVADYNRMYHANIQVEDGNPILDKEENTAMIQENNNEQKENMTLEEIFHDELLELEKQMLQQDRVLSINSKFVATNFNPFEGHKVVKVINPYSAICEEQDGKTYLIILVENEFIQSAQVFKNIKDIVILQNKKIAWVSDNDSNSHIPIDLQKGWSLGLYECVGARAVVNNNTLNLLKKNSYNGFYPILQVEFMPDGKLARRNIDLPIEGEVKGFGAKFNSKFVIVEKESQGIDTVFCNGQKLCTIHYDSSIDTHYNVIYDEFSKKWLVINNAKGGVIIHPNGEYTPIQIPHNIDDFNVDTVCFENQKIYIPGQDRLHIIKTVNNQLTEKTMECHNIMTPESKLYNINKNGFNVITNNTFYEVRKK